MGDIDGDDTYVGAQAEEVHNRFNIITTMDTVVLGDHNLNQGGNDSKHFSGLVGCYISYIIVMPNNDSLYYIMESVIICKDYI